MSATTSTDAAVGVVEAHRHAAAGFVERSTGARRRGREHVEVRAGRVERQPEEGGLAEVGHVDVVVGVGAAHVERGVGAGGSRHAERW